MRRTPAELLWTWFLDPTDEGDQLERNRAFARHELPERVCVSCPDPIRAGFPRVVLPVGDGGGRLYVCVICCSRSTDAALQDFAKRAQVSIRALHLEALTASHTRPSPN